MKPTLSLVACAFLLTAQQQPPGSLPPREPADELKLPNGRSQKDEMLKADHLKNIEDAQKLVQLSEQIKTTLEKNDRFVLSLEDIKRLDEIEKITKRLRSRLRRY